MDNAFVGAEKLWRKFIKNLSEFVNTTGQGTELEPDIIQPDYSLFRQVLSGERPVEDLGC